MGIRDTILGATTVPSETVPLPELKTNVIVRGMTGAERDAFEASCIEGRGKRRDVNTRNIRAKLVASCCIDDQGNRVFTDDDAIALGKVRADVLDRIFSVAQRLSGMNPEDIDELGKPSTTKTLSNTSSSPSPANSE